MVIGRTKDRNEPAGIHGLLQGRRRVGTRSAEPIWAGGHIRPHTGHMIANNRSHPVVRTLAARGPSTYGCPGHRRAEATPSFGRLSPGMTSFEVKPGFDMAA